MRYWYTHRSLEAAAWLEKGIFPYGYYRTPGVWEWFIHSELDDSIVRLGILIPPGYDEHKAYPAVIALSTGNEGYVGWELQQLDLGEPCFCFDVTGRGVTGGSYVGEASTLEILRWILTNFRVDEDRLYVLGGSNGGFASYALAQNHPSLPAALYPFIGYPQMETLENLSNIPTYQIVSPEDYVFAGRENAVRDRLRPYGNYHQYDMRQMAHHHLYPYLYHQEILRALLRHRRNRYPERLRFKTFRNRHCESYWVKLHGIEKGRRCAVCGRKSGCGEHPPDRVRRHRDNRHPPAADRPGELRRLPQPAAILLQRLYGRTACFCPERGLEKGRRSDGGGSPQGDGAAGRVSGQPAHRHTRRSG